MKVLFVRFSSMGNVILTPGVIKCFKQQFPDAVCDVFTSQDFAPVFGGLDFINKTISFDRRGGLPSFVKAVRQDIKGYDYIIDLHANLRSLLLRFMTKAKFLQYKKDSASRRAFVKNKIMTKRLGMHVVLKCRMP